MSHVSDGSELPCSPESSAQLVEVFLMTQEERLALMGAKDAALLRIANSAAHYIATAHGEAARNAFLMGVAVGSVAQQIIEAGNKEPPASVESELVNIDHPAA